LIFVAKLDTRNTRPIAAYFPESETRVINDNHSWDFIIRKAWAREFIQFLLGVKAYKLPNPPATLTPGLFGLRLAFRVARKEIEKVEGVVNPSVGYCRAAA
jgi:hypothetical protein